MRWRPSQIFAAAFVAIGLAVIVIGLRPGGDSERQRYEEPASCIGEHDCLPEVEFVDTRGEHYGRWYFERRVVVVNFGATSCAACLAETRALAEAYTRYRQHGLIVLGVMADEDQATLADFGRANHLDYPLIRADEAVLAAFDYPAQLPTTFVFDVDGYRVFHHQGELDMAELDRVLIGMLGEVPAAEQPLAEF